MPEKLRVCVIGAGPAGLCALRYFKAESDKFEPVAYERNLWPGGVWVYTDRTGYDETGYPVHSAMYNNLKINIPKELQEFPGFPYPKEWKSYITRQQCLEYINGFIDFFKLRTLIKTHAMVHDVEPLTPSDGKMIKWKVTVSDTRKTEEIRTEIFDSVLVCSGHHWNEYVPEIAGRDEFQGIVLHSRNFRHAELFDGLDVAILGGHRTAEDIGLQVAKTARKLHVCHRRPDFPDSFPTEVVQRPPFVRMTKNGVVFPDDTEVKVDAVIFCTGYRYSFPFLRNDIISITENRVTPLYKHLVHIKYPRLIFLSLPQNLAYFPLLNQFAKFAVRVFDGRILLPSETEMIKESDMEFDLRVQQGMKPKYIHHQGPLMWKLDKELSILGQFKPLPPVFEKLLADIIDERYMNITHAYDLNYEITGSNSYRTLNPSGSKSRYFQKSKCQKRKEKCRKYSSLYAGARDFKMAYYLDKMRMRRSNIRIVGTKKSILAKEKTGQAPNLTLGNYDIGGMACLSNGVLVTLDTAANKLKLFDRNYRYMSQTPVSIFSRSLTFTSDMEVALLCGKNIFFYFLIGKVIKRETKKAIALRFVGYRFVYARNHFAVICDVPYTGSVLLIVGDKGNEVNCIRRIRNFGEINSDVYCALDDIHDHVYCTKSKEHRIVGINYNGDLIFSLEVGWTPQLLTCIEDFIAVVNTRGKTIKFIKKTDGKMVEVHPVNLKRQPRHLVYDAAHRRIVLFSRTATGAITVVSAEKLLQLSLRIA